MKVKLILVMMLSVWIPLAAVAQEVDSREADHNALRALRDKVTHALNSNDFDTLISCFNNEFAFITADQTIITSKESMETYYKNITSGAKYKYALESMSIKPEALILTRFTSKNVGYCYGNCKNVYTLKGGITLEMDSTWSATVSKQAGQWKIDLAQVGINFLDNPVLNNQLAFLKTKNKVFGGIAIVCAMALLIILLYKRKKNGKSR